MALTCVFVFAYANCLFSHYTAYVMIWIVFELCKVPSGLENAVTVLIKFELLSYYHFIKKQNNVC